MRVEVNRCVSAVLLGGVFLLGSPCGAFAQAAGEAEDSADQPRSSGGMRMSMPTVRMNASGASIGGAGRVMMPRTTPSRLPFTYGGRRLPETTPSRIGTSYSPSNRRFRVIKREPVFMGERPPPLVRPERPFDPNGTRVFWPDGSPMDLLGFDYFVQRSSYLGGFRLPERLIAVPQDVVRSFTVYCCVCTPEGPVRVPHEVFTDFSAPADIRQRRWFGEGAPRYDPRAFVGPGAVVGEEGDVISTGRRGGWSQRSYNSGPLQQTTVYTLHAPAVEQVDPLLLVGLEREPAPEPPADAMESLLRGIVPTVGPEDLKEVAGSDDPELIRATAIGAILSGHASQGLSALAQVYRENPGLASEPLAIGGPEVQRAMRRAQSRVMSAANREDTLFVWIGAAAFLQHVEGQNGVLKRSIERGTRVGLFGELAETSSWKGL